MLLQLDLDQTLLTEAFRYVKVTTPAELLQQALRELIGRHRPRMTPETGQFSPSPVATYYPELGSLDEVITRIQNLPKPATHCQLASGLLAEHLRQSSNVPDLPFDVTLWHQTWDRIEAQMKSLELAELQAEARR